MKHDGERKVSRNRSLVAFRRAHPDYSWAEIGAEFEVSRQCATKIFSRTVELEKVRT